MGEAYWNLSTIRNAKLSTGRCQICHKASMHAGHNIPLCFEKIMSLCGSDSKAKAPTIMISSCGRFNSAMLCRSLCTTCCSSSQGCFGTSIGTRLGPVLSFSVTRTLPTGYSAMNRRGQCGPAEVLPTCASEPALAELPTPTSPMIICRMLLPQWCSRSPAPTRVRQRPLSASWLIQTFGKHMVRRPVNNEQTIA